MRHSIMPGVGGCVWFSMDLKEKGIPQNQLQAKDPLQYSRRRRKLNPIFRILRVITGQQAADYSQPKPNSADLGEMLWVKSYL